MNQHVLNFIIILLLILILLIIIYAYYYTTNTYHDGVKYVHNYINNNLRFVSKSNFDIYYDNDVLPTALPDQNFNYDWGYFLSQTIMSAYIYANNNIDNADSKLSVTTKKAVYGDIQLPSRMRLVKNVQDKAILLHIIDTKIYILAIRGSITRHDIYDDLDAKQTLYYDLDKKYIERAYVHHGCYSNWIEYHYDYNDIWNYLPNGAQLAICGHSLGAAHALFTAVAFQRKTDKKVNIMCYLYGSPRLGNNVFIEYIKKNLLNSWAVVNESDYITSLPFSAYYFDTNTYLYDNFPRQIRGNIQAGSLGLNHYINSYACLLNPEAKESPDHVYHQSPTVVVRY